MTKSLWKQRNFMLLLGGQFVSYIGTEVSSITLPLIVLALTGSPAQAGIIAAIRGFMYLIWAIPAGAIIDRWDRKMVMIIGNIGSGLAMASIAISLYFNNITITQMYIVSVIEGTFFVFANLARYTSFSRVVPKGQIPHATAQWNLADNTALLIGPPLGGFLYQTIGASLAFFTDSISYFINAVSIFFITTPLHVESLSERKAMHHEIREGLRWLRNNPIIRFINFLAAGRTILESGMYLLIIVLAKEHHASSLLIGIILASGATGGILGSLFAAKIHSHYKFKQLLLRTTLFDFIVFSFFFLATNNLILLIVTFMFYALSPFADVAIGSYFATKIPDEIKGRIFSFTRLSELGANSFGFFITGILLQYFGSAFTIAAFAILLLLLFGATVLNKKLDGA